MCWENMILVSVSAGRKKTFSQLLKFQIWERAVFISVSVSVEIYLNRRLPECISPGHIFASNPSKSRRYISASVSVETYVAEDCLPQANQPEILVGQLLLPISLSEMQYFPVSVSEICSPFLFSF